MNVNLLICIISTVLAQVSPGGRYGSVMEQIDANTLYIFGGYGRAENLTAGYLGDLWKFDIPTRKFSHVMGPKTINNAATFGLIPYAANQPAARLNAASTFLITKMYLFGGLGYGNPAPALYSDLWSFDPSTVMWTFLGGSQAADDSGAYGPPNSYSRSFRPGGRSGAGMSYSSNKTELIIFGGSGYGSSNYAGYLGDLWYFCLSNDSWAYIAGHTEVDQLGTTSNPPRPGNRDAMIFECAEETVMCYIFGGFGYNNVASGYLNDLWSFSQASGMFSPLSRGSYNVTDVGGSYGTKGTATASNVPGSRRFAAAYFDSTNNRIIIYGGFGTLGLLNDVWSYEVSSGNWAWVSGSEELYQIALASRGGARAWHSIVSASPTSFYVFGGMGVGSSGFGYLNDLWLHNIPDTWSLLGGSLSVNIQDNYFEITSTITSMGYSSSKQTTSSSYSSEIASTSVASGSSTTPLPFVLDSSAISYTSVASGGSTATLTSLPSDSSTASLTSLSPGSWAMHFTTVVSSTSVITLTSVESDSSQTASSRSTTVISSSFVSSQNVMRSTTTSSRIETGITTTRKGLQSTEERNSPPLTSTTNDSFRNKDASTFSSNAAAITSISIGVVVLIAAGFFVTRMMKGKTEATNTANV